MSDDTRLEERFRTSLPRHAEDADTSVDLVGPARTGAGRRRRRRLVTGAVGLAAAATVTVVVVQHRGDPGPAGGDGFATDQQATATWRSESWHGVELDVPDDW